MNALQGSKRHSSRKAGGAIRLARVASLMAAVIVATSAFAQARVPAEVVKTHCARCHDAGTAGAPRPGDKAAWAPRFKAGVDALVLTAIRGHGGMPPRGGAVGLTDAELRGAVLHLFDPAGPPKAPQKVAKAIPPGAGPHRVTMEGLDIYLGRVSAQGMRAYPKGSPESRLHGGIPDGRGYHHVNVSVFDTATQAPVAGARVELDIEQVGLGRESKELEAVTLAGGPSHGAYVRLVPKGNYVFVVRVTRPGQEKAVEARFQERIN